MANPERGEVDLEVGGKRYRLAMGAHGLRSIQRAVGSPGVRVTMAEVLTGACAGDFEYLAVAIWGAMLRHYPDATQADADRIIDDLGGLMAMPILVQALNEMVVATKPDTRDQGVQKKTDPATSPPTPMVGMTGTGSTSRRARSA